MNRLLLIALTAAAVSCKKEPAPADASKPAPSQQQEASAPVPVAAPWPALPASGFIRGRAATSADQAAGNAIFVMQENGKAVGTPLNIEIPQYGEWTSGGATKRVFVVQAEKVHDSSVLGLIEVDGGAFATTTLNEVKLLGSKPQ